jgi:hypothetical protein
LTFNVCKDTKENVMKYSFSISGFKLLAMAALAMTAPLSMAGGSPEVSWSLSIGSPYYPAPQIYAPPPVVYVQPQPVYVRPRPLYVQPAAVVRYESPYYVEEVRRGERHHHHGRHHGHRRYD